MLPITKSSRLNISSGIWTSDPFVQHLKAESTFLTWNAGKSLDRPFLAGRKSLNSARLTLANSFSGALINFNEKTWLYVVQKHWKIALVNVKCRTWQSCRAHKDKHVERIAAGKINFWAERNKCFIVGWTRVEALKNSNEWQRAFLGTPQER